MWRGQGGKGFYVDYEIKREVGMVVLDAVHRVQASQANDLAVRWNCKAGKCGSCSAEVNGVPRLMCMTRLDSLPTDAPITVAPIKSFPGIKDLVTDVSWNYRVNKRIPPLTPKALTPAERLKGEFNMQQRDIDRVQEFRKCIECFLCQDVCHVLRDAEKATDPSLEGGFYGPRFMIRIAGLEMHPKDGVDRVPLTKKEAGIGFCNITKCCTDVCPEHIKITDNGIIPMKERVADRYYDPIGIIAHALGGNGKDKAGAAAEDGGAR
ncbi:MAG: succinate dehydrogenase/fumarate reductase iron-sulfur subunit [Euryarchaeota archaeon]|nr:succinate dehydrogenase/fumarate reductase iron-sulfur subunit [Euryarchaeota archaeon]